MQGSTFTTPGQPATWQLTDNQRAQFSYVAMHRDTSHYILHRTTHLHGPVAIAALADAARAVTVRHQVLRARFDLSGSGDICTIGGDVGEPFWYAGCDDHDGDFDGYLASIPNVDLENGPPWRCVLVECGPNDYVLHVAASHLVFDAQSFRVLYSDLSAFYRHTPPPPLAAQFDAHGAWLRQRRGESDVLGIAERVAELGSVRLPWLDGRDVASVRAAEPSNVAVPGLSWSALTQAARRYATTPFTLALAAFGDALCRRLGTDEVLIGLPYAARRFYGADRLIGDFSNTLLVRLRPHEQGDWTSVLSSTKAEMSRAHAFSHIHLTEFLRELGTDGAFEVRFEMAAADSFDLAALSLPDVVARPYLTGRPTSFRRALAVAVVRNEDESVLVRSFVTRHQDLFGDDAVIAERTAANICDIVAASRGYMG